jgi:hypothetical protein
MSKTVKIEIELPVRLVELIPEIAAVRLATSLERDGSAPSPLEDVPVGSSGKLQARAEELYAAQRIRPKLSREMALMMIASAICDEASEVIFETVAERVREMNANV